MPHRMRYLRVVPLVSLCPKRLRFPSTVQPRSVAHGQIELHLRCPGMSRGAAWMIDSWADHMNHEWLLIRLFLTLSFTMFHNVSQRFTWVHVVWPYLIVKIQPQHAGMLALAVPGLASGHGNPFGLRQRLYELRLPMGLEAQVAQVVTGWVEVMAVMQRYAEPVFFVAKVGGWWTLVNCQILVIDFALPISKAEDQCLGFCLVSNGILRWQPREI